MHEERLLKLAEMLETKVERKAFDIYLYYEEAEEFKCGYAGCALGYAMMDPWFRRRGLVTDGHSRAPGPMNNKTGSTGFQAAMEFFAINGDEVYELFSYSGYSIENPTPKQVAKKIRKFVKEGSIK